MRQLQRMGGTAAFINAFDYIAGIAGYAFGSGVIAWFNGVGIVLLRGRPSQVPGRVHSAGLGGSV